MICISNGILPDLGDLNEDKQPKKEETPLFEFSYDNTLEEIDGAMKSFQSRFKNRRHTLSVAAYSVIGVAVIAAIIMNPEQFFAYAALIFCLVGLFYSLTDKKRARAKTLEALRDMNPEDYKATFYGDRIEIETLIKPKENEVHVKIDEEADDEIISPLKTTFIPGSDLLEFIENDESLLLIFNRQQIYCFPKRCLSVEQEGAVRDYLTNRLSGE
ncbi:MAG: YcxB family protein [Ruminococcaceae bacterium]|nr:YcxB family protein [Oscillospiraceae bacterium]